MLVILSALCVASFKLLWYSERNVISCSKKSFTSLTVALRYISSVVFPKDFTLTNRYVLKVQNHLKLNSQHKHTSPPRMSNFLRGLAHKSWSYSRNTLKWESLRKTGWAASRVKNTSCIATVFLNVAKYSL